MSEAKIEIQPAEPIAGVIVPLQSSQDAMPNSTYGEYDNNGVDLSLIRYMLRMTPLERLIVMEQHARDTSTLLEYGRRHRETKTG
jgi:hypothetical protein